MLHPKITISYFIDMPPIAQKTRRRVIYNSGIYPAIPKVLDTQ
jgi:hypothetical protein